MTHAAPSRHRFWISALLVLAVVSICLRLSWWQLDRAAEKAEWLAEKQARSTQILPNLSALLEKDDPQHYRARLTGTFDNEHNILLDNRVLNGVAGYFLLTPFYTNDGHWVLVNRGWLARGRDRNALPLITPISGIVSLSGQSYRSPSDAFVLKEEILPDNQWPLRVQKVDFEAISKKLGVELARFEIRATPDMTLADAPPLPRPWQGVSEMGPERHKAYALQWLGLAIAALILYMYAYLHQRRHTKAH